MPADEQQFRVTVSVEGRGSRTYEVSAPARDDGFEGRARTRAQWEWFRENDANGGRPLKGELVEYVVERVEAS